MGADIHLGRPGTFGHKQLAHSNMFKKGPDIDKKKLLVKASDVKKDSLTRLKHFKTLLEHSDQHESLLLFKSHSSFIYHTFIETFSNFDSNSKQRRDDLDCILFMLEKILVYNTDLIKKRWQFYSITFVMQKLLHIENTYRIRQEGVRLFILWFQTLCDDSNPELLTIFASIVPELSQFQDANSNVGTPTSKLSQSSNQHDNHQQRNQKPQLVYSQSTQNPISSTQIISANHRELSNPQQQAPLKLCSIDPLVPISPTDQYPPTDEASFYLDSMLQYIVTQITKPIWNLQTHEEISAQQEKSFSFLFNVFKRIYLQSIFPNIDRNLIREFVTSPSNRAKHLQSQHINVHSINQYVDETSTRDPNKSVVMIDALEDPGKQSQTIVIKHNKLARDFKPKLDNQHAAAAVVRQQSLNLSPTNIPTKANFEHDYLQNLSIYQSIVIKWLTRILRQEIIPGQDELIKSRTGEIDHRCEQEQFHYLSESNSTNAFQGMETTCKEMEIARTVLGTKSDNIAIAHELFRGSFMNFFQPASMKRVVNVYREWICNGRATSGYCGPSSSPQVKLGYVSFPDLLQTFVVNSSNAFLTKVHNLAMLDEQVEMCKRIMNIYRYMVMKIYMNTATWEQLLTVMLSVTEHIFPRFPPKQKETTIGGRIAPAFFQTFLVSWIRANLYVHISDKMWHQFHQVMKNLVGWRELIEEWSSTMSSLTRVLVKNVYGLNLNELPLDRPQGRRRRPRDIQSFSASTCTTSQTSKEDRPARVLHSPSSTERPESVKPSKEDRSKTESFSLKGRSRSNSDSFVLLRDTKLYQGSLRSETPRRLRRKIKSEYILTNINSDDIIGGRSISPNQTDAIDTANLKDPLIDHALESQLPSRNSTDTSTSRGPAKKRGSTSSGMDSASSKSNSSSTADSKCVLLGGNVRGWTPENSVIMWRRMLGLFGNINCIDDPEIHIIAMKCLTVIQSEFIKTRENLGVSLDNQSTPSQPNLIPPYTYHAAWLFGATHLSNNYKESRLAAYRLLCVLSIRRHDTELSQTFYASLYEALHRGLTSTDHAIHATIIENSPRILSLEMPGSTFLVQVLFERSRSILLNNPKESLATTTISPRSEAVQVLNNILALHRRIRKLMVLKPEPNGNSMNLVAPGDIRSKIYDTFLACNIRPFVLDFSIRSKSLFAMAIHVYQELADEHNTPEIDKLFDILWTELQNCNNIELYRISCDIIRLFADHAQYLSHIRPNLVTALIPIFCQLLIRMSTSDSNKQQVDCTLLCLEDWCIAVGRQFMLQPLDLGISLDDYDDTISNGSTESLITIVLKSLAIVVNGEQCLPDDISNRASRGSDANSNLLQSDNPFNNPRDRTMTNEFVPKTNQISDKLTAIASACKVAHQKLVTYLGHFPLRQVGGASLSCYVDELDFFQNNELDFTDGKNASNICFLQIDSSSLVTFIGSQNKAHLIIRNACGKYAWDAARVKIESSRNPTETRLESFVVDPDTFEQDDPRSEMRFDSDLNDDGNSTSSMSSRSSSGRDCIGDLLNLLTSLGPNGTSSSSLLSNQSLHKKRNCALSVTNPEFKVAQAEETMIALLTNQRFQEINHCERANSVDRVVLKLRPSLASQGLHDNQDEQSLFDECRYLIQQLGFLIWEKRPKIDLLTKSARLLRELKNLDAQPSRETHKIAVIYVANGQEDKQTILSNSSGSKAFEQFTSGLGWDVSLVTHLGFKGGLQAGKSAGETSLYYCNCTTEVMFHVSTRIPVNNPIDDESLNRKLRHLGNDEIHIVWSEHSRDYRRGIIPTEFGDVIISIYPMLTFHGYYRIQILSKPEVPLFGPLFDNCIVHQASLAPLVRATAINASRARRLKLDHYLSNLEERSRLIDTIVSNHRAKLSFEEFAAQMYDLPKATDRTNHNKTMTTTNSEQLK